MTEGVPEKEAEIRSAWDARDFAGAATLALEVYGAEIYSFISARLRSASEADEAFSMFAEDLWKGLPGFGFRATVRGWLYALARNAANRHATSPQRRASRNVPLSFDSAVAGMAQRSQTAVQLHLRTDVKDKVRALRKRLPIEDQTLLILFVDRNLPWREIVMIMHDGGELPNDTEIEREAARLRKRFERIKAELKAMAIAEGLLKS
jgi:RNA polymerase sigma-70 factor (ECF subfamily)